MKLKWGIGQLYFYVVCFVMLITMIVGVTGIVRSGIDLIIPLPERSIEQPKRPYEPNTNGEQRKTTLPAEVVEAEIAKSEELQAQYNKKHNFNFAMMRLFGGLAQILVALPIYLYHWRKIPLLDH